MLTEVERLTRLFQNILDDGAHRRGRRRHRARGGCIRRRSSKAARQQVEHTLRSHTLDVRPRPDVWCGWTRGSRRRRWRTCSRTRPSTRRRTRRSRSARAPTADGLTDHGARSRPGHRAGRPAAPVRAVLPGRRGEAARVGHRAWGSSIARGLLAAERGRSGRRIAPGRRRAVHDRGSADEEAGETVEDQAHDPRGAHPARRR